MTSKKELTSMHPVWKRKDGVDMNKETEKDFEFQGEKINQKKFDKEMKAYVKTLVNESLQKDEQILKKEETENKLIMCAAIHEWFGKYEELADEFIRKMSNLTLEQNLLMISKARQLELKKIEKEEKPICNNAWVLAIEENLKNLLNEKEALNRQLKEARECMGFRNEKGILIVPCSQYNHVELGRCKNTTCPLNEKEK